MSGTGMAGAPASVFTLPDLGEGLQDAEIVAWHVAEGDHVVADQPLLSVETDKAVVEIPSPRAGRIARLLAAEHARVAIGAPLVAFGEGGEHDTGTVVGELAEAQPSPAAQPSAPARPRASPAVRAMAAARGLDLSALTGSGPEGEITRQDVAAAGEAPAGAEPLRGMRRAMALRMAEAGRTVVPATVTDEADIDAWPADAPMTARLVAALVAGCAAEPALNAAYDSAALARRVNAAVHVGLAVDTGDGLIVPVLRDAGARSVADLAAAVSALAEAARARQLAPAALRDATITLSNFGSLGGLFAALVVVPPQVAILGAGRVRTCVAAAAGGFVARRMLPLSLTFDHRAVSGGEAARFLNAVKTALERAA
ncbi:MAG: 2-oxo acid dehydrogenase subunit E2 [Rhodospirillales bacterium]|nr:2-oxo acid dehydrogenase subunit E2 [Rhodospirillales bacterium]